MKKYYGFNGFGLVYIGDYDDISPALEDSERIGDFFYVTTIEEWSNFAKNIIDTLTVNK